MTGRSIKASLILDSAERNAAKPHIHPAKTTTDTPPAAGQSRSRSAAPALPATLTPRARPVVDTASLSRRLAAAHETLPAGVAEVLVARLESELSDRLLSSLTTRELDGVADVLRGEIAARAPSVRQIQQDLARTTRRMLGVKTGSTLQVSSVEIRDGAWVFLHTTGPTDTVIVGECFVADRPGILAPSTRPDPRDAGLAGRPRWWNGTTVVDTPPPIADLRPMGSGLPSGALEEGVRIILDEYRTAENAGLAAAAARPRRLTPRITGRLSADEARTAGTGITAIEVGAPAAAGPPPELRGWDRKITIKGRTGPKILRRPDRELNAFLRPAYELGDQRFAGWARVHAWGPLLGDETFAGLAYAPQKAANILQRTTVEEMLRWGPAATGRNPLAGAPLEVRVRIKDVRIRGRTYPFLRSADYTITLEDGAKVIASIEVDESGAVNFGLHAPL